MTRLSRAESQARTREQLIATAKELFLRDGYFVTSLEKVAEEAGYSKGAVYSNFRNKDELCLAVIDEIRREQIGEILTAIATGTTLAERIEAFGTWAERMVGDQGWSILEIEFGSQLRHNQELRDAYTTRANTLRAAMSDVLSGLIEPAGELPFAAEDVATALLSLGIGLGLQRAIDPSLSGSIFTDTIRVIVGVPLSQPA